jgi:hypothetical protein
MHDHATKINELVAFCRDEIEANMKISKAAQAKEVASLREQYEKTSDEKSRQWLVQENQLKQQLQQMR